MPLGHLLKTARFFFEGLLQGGNGGEALCDGLLKHALVRATTSNLPDGIRQIVLRLHDADDRLANRIADVPVTEISFGIFNLEIEVL